MPSGMWLALGLASDDTRCVCFALPMFLHVCTHTHGRDGGRKRERNILCSLCAAFYNFPSVVANSGQSMERIVRPWWASSQSWASVSVRRVDQTPSSPKDPLPKYWAEDSSISWSCLQIQIPYLSTGLRFYNQLAMSAPRSLF